MAKSKFGNAFGDGLRKTTAASGHFHNPKLNSHNFSEALFGDFDDHTETPQINDWLKTAIFIVLILTFAFLFSRIFHLQIAKGKENRDLADSNRIQVKTIHAPRGVIYDRNGQILAQNEPGFRIIDPTLKEKPKVVSRDESLKMEINNDPRLKNLEVDSVRSYPKDISFSHVLGYLGEISEDELKDPKFSNYKLGDKVGRGGVEETYEKVLKGIDGGEVIEVDSQGKTIRTLGKKEAIPGQNLYLSLDADLQTVAYKQLEDNLVKSKSCCGAVVIEDPNSGEILSLVSYPSFDPKNLADAFSNPNSPALDRAIGGTYPPGSTYKIASSLAGIISGKINADTKFEDTGVLSLGPFTFANWYFTQYGRKEEGLVDIKKALQRSNDIFFYRLGDIVGVDNMAQTSRKLGMGEKLGIDIPGEEKGLIPDPAWKEKNINEVWYPGDTLHMAIGQGYVLTTPLQISNLVSFVASDGKQFPPHLALKITSPQGSTVKTFKYDPLNKNKFNPNDLNLIRQGLEQVPQTGGTAWPFFSFPVQTAGKTGTAEYGAENKTHAWYTSYAPAQDPKIAITVLLEGGGEGSTNASPVAKEIYRWYFSPDKKNLIKDINAPIATDSARTLGE